MRIRKVIQVQVRFTGKETEQLFSLVSSAASYINPTPEDVAFASMVRDRIMNGLASQDDGKYLR